MKDINDIYRPLEQSDVSLIGYTFKSERIKDEFISKLPHINVGEINSSFSIRQFIRDYKISQILDDSYSYKEFNWIVVDINDIEVDKSYNSNLNTLNRAINRASSISKIIERLRSELFEFQIEKEDELGLDFDDFESHVQKEQKLRFKLLITSPMYKSNEKLDINNFTGGSRPLYMADFAFVILDQNFFSSKKEVNIVKNRFGYSEENKVDISNIENYNYICNKELNYEHISK